jgi:ATP-dependent DNA ligase
MTEWIDPLDFTPIPVGGKVERVEKMGVCSYEIKLDGARQILSKINNNIRLTGRRRSVYNDKMLDKIQHCPQLNDFMKSFGKDIVFDGELMSDFGGSNMVTSIIGSSPERAIKLQQQTAPLKYYIFDIIQYRDLDIIDLRKRPYSERRSLLESLAIDDPFVRLCSTIRADNSQMAFEIARRDGAEGIVVKAQCGLYHHLSWARMKAVETWDFIIMDYTASTSKKFLNNGIATLELGLFDRNGNLCHCCSCGGLTDEFRHIFYKDLDTRKYIGEVCEISGQEMFKSGTIRHPRFNRMRPDANPSEQTFAKYEIDI